MRASELLRERLYPRPEQLEALGAPAGPSYTTYGDCGPFDYDATCEEACFGFAPQQMDPWYCATCDEQAADPVNNPAWNWHFVGSRGSLQYMDREPDVLPPARTPGSGRSTAYAATASRRRSSAATTGTNGIPTGRSSRRSARA